MTKISSTEQIFNSDEIFFLVLFQKILVKTWAPLMDILSKSFAQLKNFTTMTKNYRRKKFPILEVCRRFAELPTLKTSQVSQPNLTTHTLERAFMRSKV